MGRIGPTDILLALLTLELGFYSPNLPLPRRLHLFQLTC